VGSRSQGSSGGDQKKTERAVTPSLIDDARQFLSLEPSAQANAFDAEAYLDIALTHWLPSAASGDLFAKQAAEQLGIILKRDMDDRWLGDAVRQAAARPESWGGFRDLSLAIEASSAGQPHHALKLARLAENRFLKGMNQAAWLRAKLEEVYALHRLVNGRACYGQTEALKDGLRDRSYTWIEIQAELEMSVCATMLGKFSAARAPLMRVRRFPRSGYEGLKLRAAGLEAALETVSGNGAAAWSMDRAGLARYFAGKYAPQRGYQFYSDLSFIAQGSGRWHLAAVIAEEAENLIATTPNRSMTAMATYRHAMLAGAAGLEREASLAFFRAEQRFITNPADAAADKIYRTEGEVSRAAIEASLGRLEQARSHLENVEAFIPQIADITVLLRYYQTLGAVQLNQGNVDHAEAAFRKSISLSQGGFSSRGTAAQRASWAEETAKAYRGLTGLLLRHRNQPEQALLLWNEYRARVLRPGVKLRIPRPKPFGTPSPVVLTYCVFARGVALWLFDGEQVIWKWIDVPEAELRAVAARFAEECSDPGSPMPALLRDGQWLYQRLIRPVEDAIPPHATILLEPDESIAPIPFAALPGVANQYFGVNHPIAISLGPTSGRALQSVTRFSRAVVVGSPALSADWTSNFPPLPDALREAQDVAGAFAKPVLLVLSGASYAAVRQALGTADVFHFAGHAIADWSGGALLLADPSGAISLGASEIETLPLRSCRLAVLSACTTAAGDGAAHAYGLAGAFLRAGVRQVVAVRWKVDSSAARAYTEVLYRALLAGNPLERTLHDAASALRTRSATEHPSFWAGFECYESTSPWLEDR